MQFAITVASLNPQETLVPVILPAAQRNTVCKSSNYYKWRRGKRACRLPSGRARSQASQKFQGALSSEASPDACVNKAP